VYAILDDDAWRARGVAICDPAVVEAIAGAIVAASPRPSVLQLRAKELSARDTLALLRRLVPAARAVGVPLVANDRVDLAMLAGVAGAHLGQDDLPIADAQRLAPSLVLGVSTHSLDQLERALEDGPSYVAFGPIFETTSKRAPDDTVGLGKLAQAVKLAARAKTPLVAIGGIAASRACALADVGAQWGAAISELVATTRAGAPDLAAITAKTSALGLALREAR
jgi:thiamine-phosphate pyrophosphorylase